MVYNTNIGELKDHFFINYWSFTLYLSTVAQTTTSLEYLYIIIVLKLMF